MHLQHPFSKATPCAPPLQPERRDERPVHGNSQRAMNRPFTTAPQHTRFAQLPSDSLFAPQARRYAAGTEPAKEKARFRAGGFADLRSFLHSTFTPTAHPPGCSSSTVHWLRTPYGRVHTAFQMPARRHASTALGNRARPGNTGALRAPTGAWTGRPPSTAGLPPRDRWHPTSPPPGALALRGHGCLVRSRVSPLGHFKRLS